MVHDPEGTTAEQAAGAIWRGDLTSVAVVSEALDRARRNAHLNAFVTLDEAGALQAAAAFDAANRGTRIRRPLGGVPVVIKDNIEVAGLPNTAGTPALGTYVPKRDAPAVALLRSAGAIVLGKTSMHELSCGISGYNPSFGTGDAPGVRNAYDSAFVAGGSSSGTGAAIGARIVAAGLGADTGGSVRIPAALNGSCALRPTSGRYPSGGMVPISPTRDTVGPMAATMADLALLDQVIASGPAVTPITLEGIRIGVVDAMLENLDMDTERAFGAGLAKLEAAGAIVIRVEMSGFKELNAALEMPVAIYEARDALADYLDRCGIGISIEQLAGRIRSPDVREIYQTLILPRRVPGPHGTLADAKPLYDAAMAHGRPALQALYRDTFRSNRIDAIGFPTTPKVALPCTPEASSPGNFALFIQNTAPASNAGLPGLQIPLALGESSRLPVGLELDGPAGSDKRLLAIGAACEALFGRLPAPMERLAPARAEEPQNAMMPRPGL